MWKKPTTDGRARERRRLADRRSPRQRRPEEIRHEGDQRTSNTTVAVDRRVGDRRSGRDRRALTDHGRDTPATYSRDEATDVAVDVPHDLFPAPGVSTRVGGISVVEGATTWVAGFALTRREPGEQVTKARVFGVAVLDEGIDVVEGVALTFARTGTRVTQTTDVLGRFDFADLAAGDWEFSVTPPSGFALADGEESQRPISLAVGDSLYLQVYLALANGNGSVEQQQGVRKSQIVACRTAQFPEPSSSTLTSEPSAAQEGVATVAKICGCSNGASRGPLRNPLVCCFLCRCPAPAHVIRSLQSERGPGGWARVCVTCAIRHDLDGEMRTGHLHGRRPVSRSEPRQPATAALLLSLMFLTASLVVQTVFAIKRKLTMAA